MNVIRRFENGERQSDICSSIVLVGSTIRTILKNSDNIKKSIFATASLSTKRVTRTRNTQIEEMEKILQLWIDDQTHRNMPLSQSLIMEKSRTLFSDLVEINGEGTDIQISVQILVRLTLFLLTLFFQERILSAKRGMSVL